MKKTNFSSLAAPISLPMIFSMFCAAALATEIESSPGPMQPKGSVEQILGNRVQILGEEVPIQSYISIPLPTKRFGQSAFASFSCPEHLVIGQKPDIAPPDRWWLFDERAEHLLCYSVTAVAPFAQPMPRPGSGDAPAKVSVAEQARSLAELEALIDEIAPAFFKGDISPPEQRSEVSLRLSSYVGAELLPLLQSSGARFFRLVRCQMKQGIKTHSSPDPCPIAHGKSSPRPKLVPVFEPPARRQSQAQNHRFCRPSASCYCNASRSAPGNGLEYRWSLLGLKRRLGEFEWALDRSLVTMTSSLLCQSSTMHLVAKL
jgi:hypothetical protein